MTRVFYRWLIGLHPAAFREEFAEEMLWIFDQCAGDECTDGEPVEWQVLRLFGDGFVSLMRQWILRSGMWTFGAGACISGMMIFSFGYSLQAAMVNAFRRADSRRFEEVRKRLLSEKVFAAGFAIGPQEAMPPSSDESAMRPTKVSPRIAALELRLQSGDRGALKQFWQEALEDGAPLIDPAKDAPNEVIATFLWRGGSNTQNVRLLASLGNSDGLADLPLTHLANSDVWYGSWETRKEFRFAYCLVVDQRIDDNARQLAMLDPLNPNKIEFFPEGDGPPPALLSIALVGGEDWPPAEQFSVLVNETGAALNSQ